jgi:hypothetical protein
VKWRIALPEAGNSSPVISGDRIFLPQPNTGKKQRGLLCLDRKSGKTLWEKSVKYEALLWMDGGPSQQHTFDPKPEGEFKSISTTVPGIHVTEKFPKLARCMKDMAFLRSVKTVINDHYDAKYHLHTGFRRVTNLEHPSIGSIASSEIGLPNDEMPAFVTIDAGNDKGNGGRFYRSAPAYLGPRHAPLAVQHPERGLENLSSPDESLARRLRLLNGSENLFARQHPSSAVAAKQAAFQRAVQLMRSPRAKAFDLADEPERLKDEYGRHRFGRA